MAEEREGYKLGGVTGKGFLPGQSGNPGGRPKGRTLTGMVRELMEREHNGKQIIELLAERFVKEALSGKFPFAKELWDRVEGPLTAHHRVAVEKPPLQILAEMSREEKFAIIERAGMGHLLPPPEERSGIKAAMSMIADDDFIALAIKHNRIDLLPVALRERAHQRIGQSSTPTEPLQGTTDDTRGPT